MKVLRIKSLGPLVILLGSVLCLATVYAGKPEKAGGGGGGSAGGLSYEIIRLETSDSNGEPLFGCARDVNDSRLVVGQISDGVVWHAACWQVTEDKGQFTSTWALLDDTGFEGFVTDARSCNNLGEIVGSAGDVNAAYWASTTGTLELLTGPDDLSWAHAINDQGVICGGSGSLDGSNGSQAVAWHRVNGQYTYLVLPPLGDPGLDADGQPLPNWSEAHAINNLNPNSGAITIVGQSNGNAALWTITPDADGVLVVAASLILDPGAWARGLNDKGDVCGTNNSVGGVVWGDGGSSTPLTPTYSQYGNPQNVTPVDVNDNGLIVGYDVVPSHAIFWPSKDAAPVFLEDFLAKGKNANFDYLDFAFAVNRWNEITGYGTYNDVEIPYLAVPE